MKKIVLDPEHGGSTFIGGSSPNNAIGPTGLLEKNVVLLVARSAKIILESLGYTVILTRNSDVNVGLRDRARVAALARADAFISIHFNGFNNTVQGTETFVHTSANARSLTLCRAVQPRLVAATGYTDRNAPSGIKRGNYSVINPANHFSGTASVLVECSFMDVPSEETRLRTAAYIEKLGRAIAEGVASYVGPVVAKSEAVSSNDGQISEGEDGFEGLIAAGAQTMRSVESVSAGKATSRRSPTADLEPETVDHEETYDNSDQGPIMEAATMAAASIGEIAEFDAFIETLGLRYFKPHELRFLGASNNAGGCAGKNTIPPKIIWKNITNTALMLDEIRHRLGASVTILSTYRSPEYNKCIGGATKSLHMRFNAIDFKCSKGKPADWKKVVDLVAKSDPRFRGYIGMYSTFIHIDTRNSL